MAPQDQENAVRTAASALLTAINDAKAVGLEVRWPSFPGGLSVIAISATARATAQTPAAKPTPIALPTGPTPVAAATTPVSIATATNASSTKEST